MEDTNKEKLISQVQSEFKKKFHTSPELLTLTPGRINIIGEHTDYNDGLAMPAAIDRWVCAAICKNNSESSIIYSLNYKQSAIISDHAPKRFRKVWQQLARASINGLKKQFDIGEGANIAVGGNLPIGCGLSSSTAFVIAITQIFCKLYSIQMEDKQLAHLCQKIENNALGITCGLLDQYGIILSRKNRFMLIDFYDDAIEYIPSSLNKCSWLVLNSKVQRELSKSAYLKRVKECKEGLKILKREFNISSIRDLDLSMLRELKNKYNILYKRLFHVISENSRVKKMKIQLAKGSVEKVGTILRESHESLSSLYEVSCKEIDYMIQLSESFGGWHGGRIMGGGFGGCSIHLVAHRRVKCFIDYITAHYRERFHIIPEIMKITFPGGLEYL